MRDEPVRRKKIVRRPRDAFSLTPPPELRARGGRRVMGMGAVMPGPVFLFAPPSPNVWLAGWLRAPFPRSLAWPASQLASPAWFLPPPSLYCVPLSNPAYHPSSLRVCRSPVTSLGLSSGSTPPSSALGAKWLAQLACLETRGRRVACLLRPEWCLATQQPHGELIVSPVCALYFVLSLERQHARSGCL